MNPLNAEQVAKLLKYTKRLSAYIGENYDLPVDLEMGELAYMLKNLAHLVESYHAAGEPK